MFAKLLAEKLKGEGIRVFSIDPGGAYKSFQLPCSRRLTSTAVATGLQRHFTGEFLEYVEKMRDSAERKPFHTFSQLCLYADKPKAMRDIDGKVFKMPPFTGASEGASTLITAMVDPTIEESNGAFLHHNAVADEELTSHVLDRANWTKLWELSEKLVGEPFNV